MSNTAVTIESLTNLHTGNTCACVVSGTPTGTLQFLAARNTDVDTPFPIAFTGAYPTYALHVPHRGLWYFWAQDDNGVGVEPEACVVCLSDDIALDEAGEMLRSRLEANRKGLDAMLRTWYPNTKTKQIEYGIPANITDYPSILIGSPSRQSERVGTNFLTRHDYSFQLNFLIAHAEEQSELRMAVKWADFAKDILNQQDYCRMYLPNGEVLTQCFAANGEYSEFQLDELGWCAAGTVVWTAQSRTQERVLIGGVFS